MVIDEELLWKQASFNYPCVVASVDVEKDNIRCPNCENQNCDNYMYDNESIICEECGYVIEGVEYSNYSFETPVDYKAPTYTKGFQKIQKLQEWMSWTNTEKNEYKLKKYTKTFCENLNINTSLVESVCQLVVKVMSSIRKKNDGPKRSRVKDGIIISCISYVSKENNLINSSGVYNYLDLAKKINLDIKYVSKADKILMELNLLNKEISCKTEDPIDYIKYIVNKYNIPIAELSNNNINTSELLEKVSLLINICEDNDILLDHTPLSIGVACFYYVLHKFNIEIDVKTFASIFNLSVVTVTKTFNKLKKLEIKIDKMLL